MAIFIYLFFAPLISLKILTWRRPDISPHVGERIATYGIFAVLNVFISSVVVEIIRNVSKFTIRAFMFQYGIIAIVTAILLPFIAEIFITATKRGNVTLTVIKDDDAEDNATEQAAADVDETDEAETINETAASSEEDVEDKDITAAEEIEETNEVAVSSEEKDENKKDADAEAVKTAEETEEPEDLEEQDADKSEEQTNEESDQTEETEEEKEDAGPED